ncbi:hypothetical protein [Dendrosporobacter sp. 1207_IL3150]|uniref:hypothetical protein n=1 Tax=Dendrosporobacter sp. 1207_IL3150 TaxID=3084054 RepID=UPI002FD92F16
MVLSLAPLTNSQVSLDVSVKPLPAESKVMINNNLQIEADKGVSEEAKKDALEYLDKLFANKNVKISSELDDRGLSQIYITDQDSGKAIIKIPVDAIVTTVNKSREHNIGWLMNLLV